MVGDFVRFQRVIHAAGHIRPTARAGPDLLHWQRQAARPTWVDSYSSENEG